MTQHDFDIANQGAFDARTDINSALQALSSLSSGPSAPSTTYANQLWYDTSTDTLKIRNEANSAWLNVAYIDQTNGFQLFDDTEVVNTSGTQTGKLGGHTSTVWEAGTNLVEALISPSTLATVVRNLIVTEVDFDGNDGKIKLWNGFKIIWGRFSSNTDSNQSVTFWEAFDTACYGVVNAGIDYSQDFGYTWVSMNISTTGFTANRDDNIDGTHTFRYIAIGKD